MKRVKKGLILEGGAMRGMFTAGVLDVLMENKIEFDGAVGVSAGATFGCNYKSGQIGRTIRYNKRFCRDKRYCSIKSLLTTGNLYGAEFCYHTLPDKLDVFDCKAFEENPMEFYVVCTDVTTGKPVYKKIEKCDYTELEWMRGSASMPLASKVVEVDGFKLLDGGISDSIPISFFEKKGYTKNILVLTQPIDFTKTKNPIVILMKLAMKKYPMVIKAMEERHTNYNETLKYISEKEKRGEIFVIRPDKKIAAKRIEHNPKKLEEAYQQGRKRATELLEDIKEYLNN